MITNEVVSLGVVGYYSARQSFLGWRVSFIGLPLSLVLSLCITLRITLHSFRQDYVGLPDKDYLDLEIKQEKAIPMNYVFIPPSIRSSSK